MSTPKPALLRPDNFTPASRTPWGGTRLARQYKRRWVDGLAEHLPIGESWELSTGPEFPSVVEQPAGQISLEAYIASDLRATLGHELALGRTSTALLVKLIDADQPLSLQIHPTDAYAGLSDGECGKPESWYVVAHEPGAGLYLGFQPGVNEQDVRKALADGQALRALLRFVEVRPGDFFLIDAGTPHAIGAGLTLVEPQHVLPGKRGITYRYWDWDRRYDAHGNAYEQGEPRALHVEDALRVTDWDRFSEPDFLDQVRLRGPAPDLTQSAQCRILSGDGGLPSPWLLVARLSGNGTLTLPFDQRLTCLTVLQGEAQLGSLVVGAGRSAVIPACASQGDVELRTASAIASAIA